MSLILKKLCNLIIAEHFGEITEKVANDLFINGPRTVHFIQQCTKLTLPKVKESLCILIKHGFVTFEKSDKGVVYYTLETGEIIRILKYPKYIFFVKTFCGDEAEMMFEEILKHGYEMASTTIVKIYNKLKLFPPERQSSIPVLKEKFELLVKNQFLMQTLSSPLCSDNLNKDINEKPDFTLPSINIKSLTRIAQGNESDPGDKNIHWKVNFDRFTQDFRDQVIVKAVTQQIDINAGELIKQILYLVYLRTIPWSDTSNPIPFTEIKEAIKKGDFPILSQNVDQYLCVLDENSQFIQRVGDSGGGQYVVNMKEAFHQLAWTVIENVVMERFGSKAARIFRLIRCHKYIEQEKIQQLAMIPAKEAKHLTYKLLEENFVQIQELKKGGIAMAPTKIFFLFYIELNQVVRMEIEHCYHALYNIIQRREHETVTNKRIIDKQLRMQTLTANLKEHGATEEQLAEIEEMMTPSEHLQLEKVKENVKKLGSIELSIDETLFILSMYIRYHN